MKIKQKSSGRILENFPNYDTYNGEDGYFVVTFEVMFDKDILKMKRIVV